MARFRFVQQRPIPDAPIRQLSAPELKALIESGTPFELVDVRTDEERALARIDDSRLLDQAYHDALLRMDRNTPPGFPIWLWYFCPFDQSSSLDCRGFLERNQATEGDTQWVNYKRSPFSSRSTDF